MVEALERLEIKNPEDTSSTQAVQEKHEPRFMRRYRELFGCEITVHNTVVKYDIVEGVLVLDGRRIRSLYYEDTHLRESTKDLKTGK